MRCLENKGCEMMRHIRFKRNILVNEVFAFFRSSLAAATLVLTVVCTPSTFAQPPENATVVEDGMEAEGMPQDSVSIWDAANLSASVTGTSGSLDTVGEGLGRPVLVPLPTPLIIGGSGLACAWMIRRRVSLRR